jgi:hypothetical protein
MGAIGCSWHDRVSAASAEGFRRRGIRDSVAAQLSPTRKRHGARASPELRILRPGSAPASTLARICSYECTFCADCVDTRLHNVCPNCGGGFAPRPVRPAREWRPGLSVAKRPPSDKRVHLSYSLDDIAAHTNRIKDIRPEER